MTNLLGIGGTGAYTGEFLANALVNVSAKSCFSGGRKKAPISSARPWLLEQAGLVRSLRSSSTRTLSQWLKLLSA